MSTPVTSTSSTRAGSVRRSLAFSAAVAVSTLALTPWQAAQADHVCAAGSLATHFEPNPDATHHVWDVEGKITAFDTTARTITANGMTLTVPGDDPATAAVEELKLKTLSLEQTAGNATMQEAADGPAGSIVGGTVIASGTTQFTPSTAAGTYCMTLSATSVYVEMAENGIIGPLMSVDPVAKTFVVNGVTVEMNSDPRFTSDLTDVGLNPITVDDLVGHEGALMDVGGYYHATSGTLRGTVVEADVVRTTAGKDTVVIQRAQWKGSELRANGLVSVNPATGQYVSSVDVYRGAVDAAGTGCTGTRMGAATVAAADGSWTYRNRNVSTAPDTLCAVSAGGGVDDIPVSRG